MDEQQNQKLNKMIHKTLAATVGFPLYGNKGPELATISPHKKTLLVLRGYMVEPLPYIHHGRSALVHGEQAWLIYNGVPAN